MNNYMEHCMEEYYREYYREFEKKQTEYKQLINVISSQNSLYELLINYSYITIKKPEDKILLDNSSNYNISYNIFILKEYIKEMGYINDYLMSIFNNYDD